MHRLENRRFVHLIDDRWYRAVPGDNSSKSGSQDSRPMWGLLFLSSSPFPRGRRQRIELLPTDGAPGSGGGFQRTGDGSVLPLTSPSRTSSVVNLPKFCHAPAVGVSAATYLREFSA